MEEPVCRLPSSSPVPSGPAAAQTPIFSSSFSFFSFYFYCFSFSASSSYPTPCHPHFPSHLPLSSAILRVPSLLPSPIPIPFAFALPFLPLSPPSVPPVPPPVPPPSSPSSHFDSSLSPFLPFPAFISCFHSEVSMCVICSATPTCFPESLERLPRWVNFLASFGLSE